jgi:hypothetical protein
MIVLLGLGLHGWGSGSLAGDTTGVFNRSRARTNERYIVASRERVAVVTVIG